MLFAAVLQELAMLLIDFYLYLLDKTLLAKTFTVKISNISSLYTSDLREAGV